MGARPPPPGGSQPYRVPVTARPLIRAGRRKTAPRAAQAVGDVLAGDTLPRRRRLQRAFRSRGSFALFAAAVRLLSPIMLPAPGWRIVWREVPSAPRSTGTKPMR